MIILPLQLPPLPLLPLQLPPLWTNNTLIKREYSMLEKRIKLLENKIAKNVGILYKAKFILNQKSLNIEKQ